ncbi:MAG: putative transporter [Actinobacteria bacterium ADurb.Bin346]|nr:MAG: putative transporter [Actinobacteria bacterium ADurb.Bin346]
MRRFTLFKSYINLPRNVYILFIADIINSAGSFVYPFLAMFLAIKLGYSEYVSGLFLTIVIVAESLGKLLGGKLADWIGRKIVIIILSILGAAIYIVIAFLKDFKVIPYLIILAGFLKSGAFPAINALIIDSTNRNNRNDAFSLLYLGHNIGFAVGPLAAGFLFVNHISLIFLIDALTTLAALMPIIFFIKETLHEKAGVYSDSGEVNEAERAETGNVLKIFFRKPVLYGFAFISIIFSFVYSQASFSLPLYLEALFNNKGAKFYGTLMTVNAIIVIIMTIFLIAAMKKLSPIISISLAGVLFAIGFGIIFYSGFFYLFIISTIIWTFGEIINSVSSNVLIANYSPMTHRGRFNAIIAFISGAGFAVGPLLTGLFIKYNGMKNVWPLTFWLSLFAALMMCVLLLIEKKTALQKK